ncbi:MAG: zinc ribbon domain-containing protein [Patescibacteria group bacterium]|jgi:hypothetical protein
MKCKNCGFANPEDSVFCQECGEKLSEEVSSKQKTKDLSIHEEIEEGIDDVLFIPKKKKSNAARNIIIGLLILIAFLFFVSVFSSDSTTQTNTNSTDIVDQAFPISYLSIKDLDSEWGGYNRNILYLKGTLKNDFNELAVDVSLRVDFFRDKETTDLFDTRYITIIGVPANGAYSFKEEVPSFFTDKRFWYNVQIVGAERSI